MMSVELIIYQQLEYEGPIVDFERHLTVDWDVKLK